MAREGFKQSSFVVAQDRFGFHALDMCEHVLKDRKVMHGYFYEYDCCGPVFINCVCKECHDKVTNKQACRKERCDDCREEFPADDVLLWRPYDADYEDDELIKRVCPKCQEQPRHLERVRNDNLLLQRDLGDEYDYDE